MQSAAAIRGVRDEIGNARQLLQESDKLRASQNHEGQSRVHLGATRNRRCYSVRALTRQRSNCNTATRNKRTTTNLLLPHPKCFSKTLNLASTLACAFLIRPRHRDRSMAALSAAQIQIKLAYVFQENSMAERRLKKILHIISTQEADIRLSIKLGPIFSLSCGSA